MITTLDRFVGAMVGVHVGDSLGAPYETWSPSKIAAALEERNGLHFFDYPNPWAKDGNGKILPAGRPTDDSDQTADLAWSLLECDGLDPIHLRKALQDSVIHNQSRLWSGKATGAGTTTRNALSADAKTTKLNGVPMNNIGTNGSLMRTTPLALWLYGVPSTNEQLYNQVKLMSEVTHAHPHSIDACYIFTICIQQILYKNLMVSSLSNVTKLTRLGQRVESRLNDPYDFPYDPGAWPMRGTAEFSLYVALYALNKAESFAEGIEIAIKVGGDTDTYGAIAGGLLGAKFGYQNIPENWRKSILGHNQMVKFAEQIHERRIKQ